MFERHNPDSKGAQGHTSSSHIDSLLTTDDILARVSRRTRMPVARIVLWASLVLGLVAIIIVCIAMVMREQSEGLHRARAAQAAQAALMQAAARGQATPSAIGPRMAAPVQTPVSIRLSHVGSVYVDGRYLGMQTRLHVGLAPGSHALLVRFGQHAFTSSLQVGGQAGCIKCDKHKGCGALKTHAAP